MKLNRIIWVFAFGLIMTLGCGTQSNAPSGELDMLYSYADEEGDGYPDVPAPEGVETTDTVRLGIVNEITYSQAESLAGVALPDIVTNTVAVDCKLVVDIDYGDGITDRLTGTRHMGAFESKLEVLCPVTVSFSVTVVADIPLTGPQTITSFGPYVFSREEPYYDFDCNTEITLNTYVDENGNVQADVEILPYEVD